MAVGAIGNAVGEGLGAVKSRRRARPENQHRDLFDDDEFFLGEFAHGVACAFASEAAVFHSAVGHAVDAEAGDFVDHQPADVGQADGFAHIVDAVGEIGGLEAVAGAVDKVDAFVEAIDGIDVDDRGEGFVGDDAHGETGVGQHGGGVEVVLALEDATAGKDFCTLGYGFFYLGVDATQIGCGNHRAVGDVFVQGVAGADASGFL